MAFTFGLDSIQQFAARTTELSSRYDSFIERINEKIFDALGEAGTLEKREALFSLGRQLDGIRTILFGFLSGILGSVRYATPALPRGVYFSSVYQQGLLSNAFVASATESYGLVAPCCAFSRLAARRSILLSSCSSVLSSPHGLDAVVLDRNALVMLDVLTTIVANESALVVIDVDVLILLRMDVDLLLILLVLEAQLIETLALIMH